ncbi:PREDICTED: uncharacterized protein LOC108557306 [Nicrophorus vespilloides]|uniref:Uncharacterized protein LOC108557306 n=1 Tax=Nicrophorus vespilloides TaxID=110193 RepID=A0ABM1M3V5_NICVS|nr:PREDICTED: uncharacterized protein LOC108557306 [Nicrophorus vespilloides]
MIYYDEPCDAKDIQFYLYSATRSSVSISVLDPFKPSIPYEFDPNVPTKIVVHGYGGLSLDFATKNVTEAYREIGYNVIVVDWSRIAAVPCYPAAFLNTWHVGQCTAILTVSLSKMGISPDRIHIIGFSLGAHVASFASNHLQKTLGVPYSRITGLDPALPFFATTNNEWKLDASDAPFVDVLHTNAGSFGKLEAIGHVDFYINGGSLQPNCTKNSYPPLCSHMMAGAYFASTIRGRKHYGFECPSIFHYTLGLCEANKAKVLMGEHVNKKSRGSYFVDISAKLTRCLTKYPYSRCILNQAHRRWQSQYLHTHLSFFCCRRYHGVSTNSTEKKIVYILYSFKRDQREIMFIYGLLVIFAAVQAHQQPPLTLVPYAPENGQDDYHIIFPPIRQERQDTLSFGSCVVALNRECPHSDVQYFLYTREHPDNPEPIRIGAEEGSSNISSTSFNLSRPIKIVVHGYNSDMYINGLVEIKNQYLINDAFNVFAVDWSPIAQGPCYPAAVWNSRFAGRCTSLLVKRLRDLGASDIHVIGFSLGAHVAAFMANHLKPYKVPRITGLDPALPGFTTIDNLAKLDASDADFVDVLHTNVFVQGKVERCGHVDFYMNGGIVQPGCWADNRFFACNHHRAPFYFAESINSPLGFYGWPCVDYLSYVVGRCPPQEPQTLMGEYIDKAINGMYLVITDSVSPFAVGKFNGPTIDILLKHYEGNRLSDFERYKQELDNCDDNGNDNIVKNINRQPPPPFIGDEAYDHIII